MLFSFAPLHFLKTLTSATRTNVFQTLWTILKQTTNLLTMSQLKKIQKEAARISIVFWTYLLRLIKTLMLHGVLASVVLCAVALMLLLPVAILLFGVLRGLLGTLPSTSLKQSLHNLASNLRRDNISSAKEHSADRPASPAG